MKKAQERVIKRLERELKKYYGKNNQKRIELKDYIEELKIKWK